MLTRGEGEALPAGTVVLSADGAADLSDRVYQVRCAAEDMSPLELKAAATVAICATEAIGPPGLPWVAPSRSLIAFVRQLAGPPLAPR